MSKAPARRQPKHAAPVRRRRRLATVLAMILAVMVATAGTAHADLYGRPDPLPPLSKATLQARYDAVRKEIQKALSTARKIGDTDRRQSLDSFLRPGRQFLSFDPRGGGQVVEVTGDLASADRIAIVVPGADTGLTTFDSRAHRPYTAVGGGARALYAQARRTAPGTRLAVIAWLGYRPPSTISPDAVTDDYARTGAGRLRGFTAELRRVNPTATTSLLCHSYGSVVCGVAAHGLEVSDIAVYGSPGMTTSSAAALRTRARLWAARGSGDWMAYVPHTRLLGLGFGADPVSPGFGARRFAAGPAGHGDYLKPGSIALHNLTMIVLGLTGA